jgi:hypothetical protein
MSVESVAEAGVILLEQISGQRSRGQPVGAAEHPSSAR